MITAKNIFDYLKNNTDGYNNNNLEYLDFDNNNSLHISDCEKILDRYYTMQDNINIFINREDLDAILDYKKIIDNFPEYKDFFESDQAILIEEYKFALKVYKEYF